MAGKAAMTRPHLPLPVGGAGGDGGMSGAGGQGGVGVIIIGGGGSGDVSFGGV